MGGVAAMAIARQRIVLPPRAWREGLRAWRAGGLTTGDDVARLEAVFASALGAPAAVAAPSGRAGLRFIVEALELEPASEVVCSAFAYPVVPHLFRSLGFTVRFADVELETLGMDPISLEKVIGSRTSAIVATHLYGVPCRISEIADIARSHGVALIEDCAHCFSAEVGKRRAGTFGDAAYFSFETSKLINTMGGGMILARDAELAERIRTVASSEPPKGARWLFERLVRTTFEAVVTHPLVFNGAVYPMLRLSRMRARAEGSFASGYHSDAVTFAGRMGRYTDVQARLALAQIGGAAAQSARRRENTERLIAALEDRVHFQRPSAPGMVADFMLVTGLFATRHAVADALLRAGIDTKSDYMQDCNRIFPSGDDCPKAVRAEREVLHLPAFAQLSPSQIDRVAHAVRRVLDDAGIAIPVDS